MATRIFQVDAFTSSPFSGNPAAVCLLPEPKPASWMQNVGAEMNLSETAFIWPLEDGYSLLGIDPVYCAKFGPEKYLVIVADEQIVRSMEPDFAALRQIQARAVCVTSRAASDEVDFVSRYFAPWIGIDEDPVTGSSHTCLTPYWAAELGKENMVAYQASPRGGLLRVSPNGDRVIIRGEAVTVLAGELFS
jgi:predicted PhzF superfamily epimerase YddE/YHI9